MKVISFLIVFLIGFQALAECRYASYRAMGRQFNNSTHRDKVLFYCTIGDTDEWLYNLKDNICTDQDNEILAILTDFYQNMRCPYPLSNACHQRKEAVLQAILRLSE